MNRHTVRNALLAQHAQIRLDIEDCRALAERLLAGEAMTVEFDDALARLRSDFDDHNRAETSWLLPLLLHDAQGQGTRGTLLAERMLEEHAAEHDAFWGRLEGDRYEIAANLGALIDDLDAHMAAEERTFLSPLILRRDELEHVVSTRE